VVVLNHPRNIHSSFQPFAATNFNAVTGENLRGFEFPAFDAMEVANSSALQSDWMINFLDWFAVLNYGYRYTGVGSSDGHDVSRYIVGQGRTYIACDDRDPAHVKVDEACRNLKRGRAVVSLGLLTTMSVDNEFKVGDLATRLGDRIQVSVTVQGPSWVQADRIQLFANGIQIAQTIFGPAPPHPAATNAGSPLRVQVTWDLPRPRHDFHLIALASGPPILEPYWALARPYQPSSPVWNPRVIGATNPIWVDGDGDGQFTPARGYAQKLFKEAGADRARLLSALAAYDEAVAVQAASFCHSANVDLRAPEWKAALQQAAPQVQKGFAACLAALAASASLK
jgi:hypothetical protein